MSKDYGDGYCAGLEAGAEERDAVWRHANGLAIERDRLLSRVAELEAGLEEMAKPPYKDSDLHSLMEWVNARARELLNKSSAKKE